MEPTQAPKAKADGVSTPADLEGRRFYVRLPDRWDEMSDAEREAASLEMAREAQRELGIRGSEPVALPGPPEHPGGGPAGPRRNRLDGDEPFPSYADDLKK